MRADLGTGGFTNVYGVGTRRVRPALSARGSCEASGIGASDIISFRRPSLTSEPLDRPEGSERKKNTVSDNRDVLKRHPARHGASQAQEAQAAPEEQDSAPAWASIRAPREAQQDHRQSHEEVPRDILDREE